MIRRLLALAALAGVLVGGVLRLLGDAGAADVVWAASTGADARAADVVGRAHALAARRWRRRDRARRDGVGACDGRVSGGAVVAVMLAGGNALEEYAAGRARRELTKLLERAPRIAHRRREGAVEEVPVDELLPGDIVVVRAGEVDSGRRRRRRARPR